MIKVSSIAQCSFLQISGDYILVFSTDGIPPIIFLRNKIHTNENVLLDNSDIVGTTIKSY